jgi:hypothetical protein
MESVMCKDKPKPAGSGWFSLIIGVGSIVAVVAFTLHGKTLKETIDPELALAIWMVVSGNIMFAWGLRRIITTESKSFQVGQETINFCVAVMAVTFTILAIILQKG